jgi:hypothetical protein
MVKPIWDTVHTEVAKDKPTTKFEGAVFAMHVQLNKVGVIKEPATDKAEKENG